MVSSIFIIHGITRSVINKTVGGFGEFLDSKGFVVGLLIAWIITVYEIIGGLAMAAGKYVSYLAIGFIIHQLMGIILVHVQNGWFVVGGGTGGMEYSVLIISSLLLLFAFYNKKSA
jgi:putative oxidoreductase